MADSSDTNNCGGCATTCATCEDCSCGSGCDPRACICLYRDLRAIFDGDDGMLVGDEEDAFYALVGGEDDEGCPQECLGGCPVCKPEFIVGSAAMARAYLGRG